MRDRTPEQAAQQAMRRPFGCSPLLAWHRRIKARALPKSALTRATSVEGSSVTGDDPRSMGQLAHLVRGPASSILVRCGLISFGNDGVRVAWGWRCTCMRSPWQLRPTRPSFQSAESARFAAAPPRSSPASLESVLADVASGVKALLAQQQLSATWGCARRTGRWGRPSGVGRNEQVGGSGRWQPSDCQAPSESLHGSGYESLHTPHGGGGGGGLGSGPQSQTLHQPLGARQVEDRAFSGHGQNFVGGMRALDALRSGRPEECEARRVAGPSFRTFLGGSGSHDSFRLHETRDPEQVFSRILGPRWAEVALHHLRDQADCLEKRAKLNKPRFQNQNTEGDEGEKERAGAKAKAKTALRKKQEQDAQTGLRSR